MEVEEPENPIEWELPEDAYLVKVKTTLSGQVAILETELEKLEFRFLSPGPAEAFDEPGPVTRLVGNELGNDFFHWQFLDQDHVRLGFVSLPPLSHSKPRTDATPEEERVDVLGDWA